MNKNKRQYILLEETFLSVKIMIGVHGNTPSKV